MGTIINWDARKHMRGDTLRDMQKSQKIIVVEEMDHWGDIAETHFDVYFIVRFIVLLIDFGESAKEGKLIN